MRDESQNVDDVILEFIIAHEPLIRHTIGLNIHNPVDVEDIYQETVLVILKHFRKGKQVEHPKAWMMKIAKSKCVDFQRRNNRNIDLASFISRAAFGGGVSIADEQHQAVVVKEIHNVISKMKPIYRDVGKLHIQGNTTREISQQLKVAEGTVRSRIRKFQQLIQEYLEVDTLRPR